MGDIGVAGGEGDGRIELNAEVGLTAYVEQGQRIPVGGRVPAPSSGVVAWTDVETSDS